MKCYSHCIETRIRRSGVGIIALAFALLCLLWVPSAVASPESVEVDVGELEAGKSVTVQFRATVSNDLPADTHEVVRNVTVSGDNFSDATATTTVPVAKVVTDLGIEGFSQAGSSVGTIQLGESVDVEVAVETVPPGGPLPAGESVTVTGAGDDCVAVLNSVGEGSCELTPEAGGNQNIEASFSETSDFEGSADTDSLLVNRPPVFDTTPVTAVGEGLAYSYNIVVTDEDQHVAAITAPTLPGWMGITDNGDNTADLTGTPGTGDVGNHSVVIRADDGQGGITDQSFTVTVEENNLPVFTSTPVTEVGVLHEYSYTITVTDADDDSISLSVDNEPAWLSINQTVDNPGYAEAVLSGTPGAADDGSYNINVIANDGRGQDVLQSFNLEVLPNNPPVFESSPVEEGGEGLSYEYEVVVTDADDEEISLSKDPKGLPWMEFNQTVNDAGEARGVLSASPEMGHAGNYNIVLTAEDERGATTLQSFTLEIETNYPPAFLSAPVTDADEGIEYVYEVEASDPDDDELSFSMTTGPDWLSLEPGSESWLATLSGVPGPDDVGSNDVTLEVSDGRGGVDTQDFTVTVAANQPPSITSTPPTTADEAVEYSYTVVATDPDGDAVSFSAPTLPGWLTLVDQGDDTAILSGTPGSEDGGNHPVVIEASDGRGGVDQQSFTIEVAANQPPVFDSSPETEVREGDDYLYAVVVSDPDGDPVDLSATTLPDWLSFVDQGGGSGELTGTPGSDDVGTHPVVLVAEDDRGGETEQTFEIEVSANQPPQFDSSPETSAREGDAYSYAIVASDPEDDPITLTAPTLPDWLTLDDHGDGTGELTGTPGEDDAGEHEVVLRAEDDRGGYNEQAWTLVVDALSPPELVTDTQDVNLDLAADGTGGETTLEFTNDGEQVLVIEEIVEPEPPFSLSGGTCLDLPSLETGESCTLDVRFDPEQTGNYESQIEIISSAENSPMVISLTARYVSALPVPVMSPVGLLLLMLAMLWIMCRRLKKPAQAMHRQASDKCGTD